MRGPFFAARAQYGGLVSVTMNHPVFGLLEHSELSPSWSCGLPIPPCLFRAGGERVFYLSIVAEDQEAPTDEAVALWLGLFNRPPEFSVFLENAMFAAYQRDLPHYQSMMRPGEAVNITQADQVWEHVGLYSNAIKPTSTGGLQLVVGLSAKWRREYGMDLVFRDGQLGVGEGLTPWEDLLHVDLPA